MNDSQKLNITIAKMLGLEIATKHVSPYGFSRRMEDAPFETLSGAQSVERTYAGGNPIRLYHRDANLAVGALEQICDERKLVAEPYRAPGGDWVVELSSAAGECEPAGWGKDKSFPLAICKALAGLEQL